ncbi:MAG: hypothetical protein RLZZ470_1252 [Pseudomonadota bacterium]|jgi:cyclopropane-fatty-acyl-phospholipid synthase
MSIVIGTPSASHQAQGGNSKWFAQLLAGADIHLNGSRPWDIHIKHPLTLQRWMREGSLGMGESYMDGWWECQAIDQMMTRALRAGLQRHMGTPQAWWHSVWSHWTQQLPVGQGRIVGRAQYDFSNDLYAAMLDTGMNNSSACWQHGATTLEQAQTAKLDMICRKLQLEPGMRLLDLGCGWGSLMRHAAKYHGVTALGITHSEAQMQLAQRMTKGLSVRYELMDYRQFNTDGRSQFDRVVSASMLHQVTQLKDPAFFSTVRRSMKKDGLLLIEAMGNHQPDRLLGPWMEKHILGKASLPSIGEITEPAQAHFVLEDVHNLGADHDRTLLHWHQRFELAWPQLRLSHDERFYRLWRYHLLSSAGSFRARSRQIWQMVMSPKGLPGVYRRAY